MCRSTPGRRATSVSPTRTAGASPAASATTASDPTTTATAARSRGSSRSSTWPAARCSRWPDYGVVALPPDNGAVPRRRRRRPAHRPARRSRSPSPTAPSWTIDGNLVTWQRWSLRVSMDPYEGLVLHTVGYEDGGRVRPILHRASVSEMVVPYGHPGPMHGWKNAFDAGEWGLGRMANSLTLGCDCLGRHPLLRRGVRHRDGRAVRVGERHLPARGGLRHPLEARRPARRHDRGAPLAPAGHQLDRHGRQLRVRLLLVPLPRRHDPARGEAHRHHVDHGGGAGHRARPRVDGGAAAGRAVPPAPVQRPPRPRRRRPDQHGLRGRRRARPGRAPTTRSATPSPPTPPSCAASSTPSAWSTRPAAGRGRSSTPRCATGWASRSATSWCPGATPTLLASPDSSVGRRAGFATRNLWVTPYEPAERRAAGDHPNQHAGGDGLPGVDRGGP